MYKDLHAISISLIILTTNNKQNMSTGTQQKGKEMDQLFP